MDLGDEPNPALIVEWFHNADLDNNGAIDFNEYVVAMAMYLTDKTHRRQPSVHTHSASEDIHNLDVSDLLGTLDDEDDRPARRRRAASPRRSRRSARRPNCRTLWRSRCSNASTSAPTPTMPV